MPSRVTFRLALALLAETLLASPAGVRAADPEPTPEQVFEKRILPIFKSPDPSSCVQCHLSGVDLKNYILPSSEKTFLSLRDQGLIDLRAPADSKILRLINMREAERRGANLIHEQNRKAEYDAFAAWLRACCADPRLRDAPPLGETERAKPPAAPEVIRHGRKDRVLESFEQNVWSMRFRCMNCHTEGSPENDKHRQKYGARVTWIKKAGAEATMNYLIRETKLIDTAHPEKSLLLTKPLGEVEHGGGKKFLPGDHGYKAFRAWIEDYAAVKAGKYARAADLPPAPTQAAFGSDIWLKLSETPPEWGDKLLAVRVFAWDERKQAWEAEPIAQSDRGVWGKGKLWQHNLTLYAPKGSPRAEAWRRGQPALPPGKYLVKVYVDADGRLARDWKTALRAEDYVGQAELQARWREGYGQMTVLDARAVKK